MLEYEPIQQWYKCVKEQKRKNKREGERKAESDRERPKKKKERGRDRDITLNWVGDTSHSRLIADHPLVLGAPHYHLLPCAESSPRRPLFHTYSTEPCSSRHRRTSSTSVHMDHQTKGQAHSDSHTPGGWFQSRFRGLLVEVQWLGRLTTQIVVAGDNNLKNLPVALAACHHICTVLIGAGVATMIALTTCECRCQCTITGK